MSRPTSPSAPTCRRKPTRPASSTRWAPATSRARRWSSSTSCAALGYPIVAAGKGKNNAFKIDADAGCLRRRSDAAQHEPAHAGRVRRRLEDDGGDGGARQCHRSRARRARHARPDGAARLRCTRCSARREEGGLLSRKGVVDFTVAPGVAPGVFAIAEMRHPRLRERMNDLQLGEGPYYTFFRPYHLTSLEVPLSAAAAVLFGQSHMRPLPARRPRSAPREARSDARRDARRDRRILLSRLRAVARRRDRLDALAAGPAQGAKVTRRSQGRIPDLRQLRARRAPADRAAAPGAGRHARCGGRMHGHGP